MRRRRLIHHELDSSTSWLNTFARADPVALGDLCPLQRSGPLSPDLHLYRGRNGIRTVRHLERASAYRHMPPNASVQVREGCDHPPSPAFPARSARLGLQVDWQDWSSMPRDRPAANPPERNQRPQMAPAPGPQRRTGRGLSRQAADWTAWAIAEMADPQRRSGADPVLCRRLDRITEARRCGGHPAVVGHDRSEIAGHELRRGNVNRVQPPKRGPWSDRRRHVQQVVVECHLVQASELAARHCDRSGPA